MTMAEEAIRVVLAYRRDLGFSIHGGMRTTLRTITVAA